MRLIVLLLLLVVVYYYYHGVNMGPIKRYNSLTVLMFFKRTTPGNYTSALQVNIH